MSTTIDQRVVEMRFDNKQFESNVETTMATLGKLKKSLQMDGASKGLEDVNSAAKKVDMSGIGNSVETVKSKFSALEVMGVTALVNITNSAVNAGKRIVSALTIDPPRAGFNEYELKMGSIQTIMASTGEDLDTVNDYLNKLNEYSDRTIYSFQDMTSNIGKFTNAGINLKDSVAAIQGVANVAAVSGANANEASRAMYNFSQALSSGYVKLIDWKSIENANMATVEFKQQLIDSAVAAGTLTKTSDGMYKTVDGKVISATKNFNDSLQDQWMTSEVLIKTLNNYSDETTEIGKKAAKAATEVKTFSQLWDTLRESAQSGWAQTWEILVGDFEEAKKFLSELSDLFGGWIGSRAEARNDLLENWSVLGGRDDLIQSFRNIVEGISSIVKPIKEAFREIFPPTTAETLKSFSEGLKNLTDRIKISDETAENLKRTFRGVFAVVDIVKMALGAIFRVIGSLLGVTGSLGGGILSITAKFGDWLVQIRDAIKHSEIFTNVFGGIAAIIRIVMKLLSRLANAISESFVFTVVTEGLNALLSLVSRTKKSSDGLAESASRVRDAWVNSGLYKILSSIWGIIKSIVTGIAKIFSGMFTAVTEAFSSGDFKGGFDFILAALEGGFLVALISFIKRVKEMFSSAGLIESICGVFDEVGETFKAFQDKLKAEALKEIATAIAILVASLVVLSFIDGDKLSDALTAITILIVEMAALLALLKASEFKLSKDGISGSITGAAGTIRAIGFAILLMAAAMKVISDMKPDEMYKSLGAIAALIAIATVAAIALGRFGAEGRSAKRGASAMITMSLALLIMTQVAEILGEMEWTALGKAGAGLLGLLTILVAAQAIMSKLSQSKVLAGSIALNIMSVALLSMSGVVAILSLIPWQKMLIAGGALLGILSFMVAAQVIMSKLNQLKVLGGSLAMIVMATALVTTVGLLLLVPIIGLIKAAVSLIGFLTLMVAAQAIMSLLKPSKVLAGSAAMAIMAVALNSLIPILLMMSLMDITQLAASVGGLFGILVALSTALITISKLGGSAGSLIAAAGAIYIVAASLLLLVPALALLGAMNIGSLITSLAALVGVFGLIFVAIKFLPVSTLLAFASAMASVGVGMLALGAGLLLVGVGLTAIGLGIYAIVGSLTYLVGSIAVVATAIITLVASIIEGLIRGFGAGLVALFDVFIEAIPKFTKVVEALIVSICDALIACIPKIVETVLEVVAKVLQGLVKFVPTIIEGILDVIIGVINGIAKKLPALAKSIVDLIFAFIKSIIEALGSLDSGGDLLGALLNTTMLTLILTELAALAALAPFAMAGVIAMGVVIAELTAVLSAIGLLGSIPGVDWLVKKGGDLMEEIGIAIGKFVGGIFLGFKNGTSSLPDLAADLSAFARNIRDFLDIAPKLASVMTQLAGASIVDCIAGFFGGGTDSFAEELPIFGLGLAGFSKAVKDVNVDQVRAATKAATELAIMADAVPNSGGVASWFAGENSIAQFGDELIDLGKGLAGFSDAVKNINAENVKAAARAAKELALMADEIPNSGGVASWFAGENSIAQFGDEIVDLGVGLAGFSDAVENINAEKVKVAAGAAMALAEMTHEIPNSGGVISWFTGDNSIAQFGGELGDLGRGLRKFSESTGGIVVDNVKAAVQVAKDLAGMTHEIPNTGGVISWFTGENSIAQFGDELEDLGEGLADFAETTNGINASSAKAAAQVAVELAKMSHEIPNHDGIASWFAGDNSIAEFGEELGDLGEGLGDFAKSTEGMNVESSKAAAQVAKTLAEMSHEIPNHDGIASWFAGDNSVSEFGEELGDLGAGLLSFSKSSAGINVDTVKAAASSAASLAKMANEVPNTGGLASWFTGDNSLSNFAEDLPDLGRGLLAFSLSASGINADNIKAASDAAGKIVATANNIPNTGGIASWFAGDQDLSEFASKLPALGFGIKAFSNSVEGIKSENVTAGANAALTISKIATTNMSSDSINGLVSFGSGLVKFGSSLKTFFADMSGITSDQATEIANTVSSVERIANFDSSKIDAASTSIKEFSSAMKGLSGIAKDAASSVHSTLDEMAKVGASNMKAAGEEIVKSFAEGIESISEAAEKVCKTVASNCVDALRDKYDSFESAGKYVVSGFAEGISENTFAAEAKAEAMAEDALDAARAALDEHSPSKKFYKIGAYGGEGFVNGLAAYGDVSYDAGSEMAASAKHGLQDAIAGISDALNGNMDLQPTIRPVLDLSDVRAGAGSLSSIFGNNSVSVLAGVNSASAMMNRRVQNGGNGDVVSAIDKLGKKLNNVGNTYNNINGVTYDDGSNIIDAVAAIVRAAKMERRV